MKHVEVRDGHRSFRRAGGHFGILGRAGDTLAILAKVMLSSDVLELLQGKGVDQHSSLAWRKFDSRKIGT